MKIKLLGFVLAMLMSSVVVFGQTDRWQQAIKYEMEIDMDVETHQFQGKQKQNTPIIHQIS